MGYNLIVFFFLLFFSLANAGLNFYISQQESFRVLGKMKLHPTNTNFLLIYFNTLAGLVAELAYVRDGSINDVAQHFVVPVPSHIQELCFVWVNADSKAVNFPTNL
jgi:hypothetical protein